MTNAEWAIINRPDLFSGFDCAECVKSYDGKHCPLSEDEINDTECAKGHVEWLMQPRESASEGEGGHVSVSDECEPAEKESAAPTDADSREKLEADARKVQERIWDAGARHDGIGLCHIIELLDRQAAITEMESDAFWADRVRELEDEVTSLESDRDDLIDHRDSLEKHVRELKERNCPGYDPECHYCRWHDADFELNADRLNDLRRENAKLKKRIDELNHAENAPETPERVCRTCRWFEPEKWVKTGKGTENFRHAKCHRGPGSFPTDADDWCGEWSA